MEPEPGTATAPEPQPTPAEEPKANEPNEVEKAKETQAQAAKVLAELKEQQRTLLFETGFLKAGLCEESQTRIRELFEGKEVTKETLDEAIGKEKAFVQKLQTSDGNPKGVGPAANVSVEKDQKDKWSDAVYKMLKADPEGFGSLHESYVKITGHMDPDRERLARAIMKAMAFAIPGDPDLEFAEHHQSLRESHALEVRPRYGRITEAISTATWAEVFGDSIRRVLLDYYQTPEMNSWRPMVSIANVPDFRTNRRVMRNGFNDLATVGEAGTYQEFANPTDFESTYAVAKRGGLVIVSLESITNDDLGAVRRIPQDLGLAAARTLSKRVLNTCLFDNPTVDEDSTALIAAGHNNNTTVALSFSEVQNLREKMAKQTDGFTSERLGIMSRFLVVTVDLEDTAWEIVNSNVKITGSEDSTVPSVVKGRFRLEIIVNPWNTSTTKYFLVGDPRQNPTIEVGFLGGRQNPEMFVQDQPNVGSNFTADQVTWKVRHTYECKNLDFRPFAGRVA